MENMVLSPIAIDELAELVASKVEARIGHFENKVPRPDRIGFDEARDELGMEGKPISKSLLYKMTMNNEIPVKHFGRRLVFSRKELKAWMESKTVPLPSDNKKVSDRITASALKHLK